MATIKQFKYNWLNPITLNKESTGGNYIKGKILKAGIQAPPGTRFEIILVGETRGYQTVVGRSGILEIDYDGIIISQIKIIETRSTIKNYDEMHAQQTEALANINSAIETYQGYAHRGLEQVENFAVDVVTAYNKFLSGVQGIYEETTDVIPVDNILIDYIVEEEV